ncbi:MAG: polyribonucleotide nucleotidyltransferase [Rhodothermales bacterium]
MEEAIRKEIEIAPGKTITLETGRLAKQADGAVVVRQGETMVLCTAVMSKNVKTGQSWFPLTVDYREKFSAGGKIPGGFIKREGRPTDKEVLSCRLIDRAIRPLFPDGFLHETQIIAYVISADDEYDADVLAGVGASAALMIGGAPFDGPIAEVRVGRVDGRFVVNPTMEQTEEGDIDLVVAGKEDAIMMVEGEMEEISEDELLEALDVAHAAIKTLCRAQHELVEEYGRTTPFEPDLVTLPDGIVERVREALGGRIKDHLRKPYDKNTFYDGISEIKESVVSEFLGEDDPESGRTRADATEEGYTESQIRQAVSVAEKQDMREMILDEGRRLDGRRLDEVRDIWTETGYLPRVHGSAIFTRGETQVLASITLGTGRDVQAVDQVFDTEDKRFYLHYNFPPFCTGEAKFLRGASRREIGHGMLAERALQYVLPTEEEFPYTIRINADVLESNGSSSMASVCSGSMALMDAGVPLRKPVAGIAMGLVSEGERTAILTDILGTEDHLGDMDFKLTGTRDGVTACQMDIKIAGLDREVLRRALAQARDARSHILNVMEETISEPSPELSPYAPRLTQIAIDAEFIGAVIGPGGKIIQGIQRDTNTSLELEERDGKGYITIAATNQADAQAAIDIVKGIVAVPEPGEIYEGTVKNILGFGAIIEILPGKEGLLHISELDHGYVENVEDYLQVGDKVKVELIEVRNDGKLRLSRKAFVEPKGNGQDDRSGGRR